MNETVINFDRFRVDRSPHAAAKLVEAYYPLVKSVCYRYLRRKEDVEDAIQETFIKLLRHVDAIRQHPQGWLVTAAHSTCMDFIRRSSSEHRRDEGFGHTSPIQQEHRLLHEAIHQKLHEALLQLDARSRDLIIERFVRRTPLRVISGRYQTSVPTISRHTAQAVADLAAVLRDMGLKSADDLTVAEHFGLSESLADSSRDEPLRFAPDWHVLESKLNASAGIDCASVGSPAIRVGVLLSYATTLVIPVNTNGVPHSIDLQVRTLELLPAGRVELVTIAEPGTTSRAPVERAMRDYGLTAGLIDATKSEDLETLDVIVIGANYDMSPVVARALSQAVRSGVGLLNEGWLGSCRRETWSNSDLASLLLAESPVHNFHLTPCYTRVSATVVAEHEVVPHLKLGDKLHVHGCGQIFLPAKGANVVMRKNFVITPEQHGISELGFVSPPAYIVGELGRGRVVVANESFHSRTFGGGAYLFNLLTWLAEPRRRDLTNV